MVLKNGEIRKSDTFQALPKDEPATRSLKSEEIKVASFFCGCGGLDYGFHNNKNFKVVYANDFDKYACASYEKYYKFKPTLEDITKIKDIPDCDLITGGFPCQGFSMANYNRHEGDVRNVLYKELVRILKLKSPKYFIFENVRGLLNMGGYENKIDKKNQQGKIFKMIVKDLEECGYKVYTKLFKMKFYDIPQNRERIILIGVRHEFDKKIEFPEHENKINKVLNDAIGDLHEKSLQNYGTKSKVKINGFIGNKLLEWDKVSPTITGGSMNIHPDGKRRLTIRENARIQTFPDDFEFQGPMTRIYKQIGNAVPPKFSLVLANIISNHHF